MGLFGAKHDNDDVHARDPEEEDDAQDPEEDNDITLLVTYHDGHQQTLKCAEYVTPDSDQDTSNIVLTQADDKQIWLNERFVVSIEEL